MVRIGCIVNYILLSKCTFGVVIDDKSLSAIKNVTNVTN